eukprot:3936410-Rhodomonas_salina.1
MTGLGFRIVMMYRKRRRWSTHMMDAQMVSIFDHYYGQKELHGPIPLWSQRRRSTDRKREGLACHFCWGVRPERGGVCGSNYDVNDEKDTIHHRCSERRSLPETASAGPGQSVQFQGLELPGSGALRGEGRGLRK